MVLRQIFCRFTGCAVQTHCARRPQLVSKKFWGKKFSREQIFTSWRLIAKIAKISTSRKFPAVRYSMCSIVMHGYIMGFEKYNIWRENQLCAFFRSEISTNLAFPKHTCTLNKCMLGTSSLHLYVSLDVNCICKKISNLPANYLTGLVSVPGR